MAAPYTLGPVYDSSPNSCVPPSSRVVRPASSRQPPVICLDSSPTTASSLVSMVPLSIRRAEVVANSDERTPSSPSEFRQTTISVGHHNSSTSHASDSLTAKPCNEHHVQSSYGMDITYGTAESKKIVNTSFSLNKMHKMFVTFDREKRALLDSIGLGGLLKVHNQRLQCRNLILSLLTHMDPNSGTISLKSGKLTVKDRDVNFVLGIPYGGEDINLSVPCTATVEKVRSILLLDNASDITIETVNGVLLKQFGRKMNEEERNAFKVAAILFVDYCFLGPRGCKWKINKDIFKHIVDPSNIPNKNWAGYVLSVLRESASRIQDNVRAGKKTVVIDGCLFFLLVFYLDNLNFGYMRPRHDILPRVSKFTPSLVSELLSYDQRSTVMNRRTQVGRTKLRARETVIYTRSAGPPTYDSATRRRGSDSALINPLFIHVDDLQKSSETQSYKTEDHHDLNIAAIEAAFEENFKCFRRYLCRATDELECKTVVLLHNFHNVWTSQQNRKDVYGDHSTGEGHTGKRSNVGFKAKSRVHYACVETSSTSRNSSLPNLTSATTPNADVPNTPESNNNGQSRLNSDSLMEHHSLHIKDVSSASSAFGPSPFALCMNHKDVPVQILMALIKVLPKLCDGDKKMNWYIHDVPTFLQIGGETLYHVFYDDMEFSSDVMSAVIRLYAHLDNEMYTGLLFKRWRHFLPSEWATLALMGEDLLENNLVKDMFCGSHISYEAGYCRMVLVPVYDQSSWSLYAWDFCSHTISILDPIARSYDLLARKHNHSVSCLHDAIISCKIKFLGYVEAENELWDRNYLTETDGHQSMLNSGLYTAFYARFFDGVQCTRSMDMEDSIALFQTSLLYQLLVSSENKGQYPEEIQRALSK